VLVGGEASMILSGRPASDSLESFTKSGLFQAVRWMARTADTVEISDGLTVKFLDEATGRPYRELHPGQRWTDAGIDVHGRAGDFLLLASRTEKPVNASTPHRTYVAVESMDAGTGVRDTLAILPASMEFASVANTQSGVIVLLGARPAFTSTLHARARCSYIIVLDGLERLWIFDASGTFIRRLDPAITRRAVTEASRAHYIAGHAATDPLLPHAADSLPLFDRLEVDDRGGIWLELFSDTASTQKWLRFDERGAITASLALPAELRVLQLDSDRVLTSTAEGPKAERLRVYRLLEAGPR
jgi:hypothetical protein